MKYQVHWENPQHRAVFLILKHALCLRPTAASTPHGRTVVGMHCLPPGSLFHVTPPPPFWNNMCKGQERADQRELESAHNIRLLLALEEGPTFLLLITAGLPLFLEHVLCWAAVCPGSPSVTERVFQVFVPSPSPQRALECCSPSPFPLRMGTQGIREPTREILIKPVWEGRPL